MHETPFEAYLNKIWDRVDSLHDKTGISDWLYLDESVDINAAAQATNSLVITCSVSDDAAIFMCEVL